MGKILVTVTRFDERCAEAKKLLEDHGHEIIIEDKPQLLSPEDRAALVKDVVAAIIGTDPWDEAMFNLAPNVKIIARFGVGYDNVDTVLAKKRGIKLTNAAGGNAEAVAEITIGLMVGALRNITGIYNDLKEGIWTRFIGYELAEKTIGLIGFGHIAQRVAKILKAFDANVIVYKLHPDETLAKKYGVKMMSRNEVIANSDILSLHIPGTPDNIHMMNDETFGMMKKGSYFINMGRGCLVDEEALIRAIDSGRITGAGLDVYEKEPLSIDSPLLRHERIICLPHTAGETFEAYRKIALLAAHAILDDFAGKEPANWVNR